MIKKGSRVSLTDLTFLKDLGRGYTTNSLFKVHSKGEGSVWIEYNEGWKDEWYGDKRYWCMPIRFCVEALCKPKIGGKLVP
jgi:hypothetical protein